MVSGGKKDSVMLMNEGITSKQMRDPVSDGDKKAEGKRRDEKRWCEWFSLDFDLKEMVKKKKIVELMLLLF